MYRRIYFYLNILIVLSIAVPWAMITSPIQAASQVDNVSSDPRKSTNIIRDQLHSNQSNISSAVDSDSRDIYPGQTFIPIPTQYVPHKNLPPSHDTCITSKVSFIWSCDIFQVDL